jgi:hypothetical protein
MKGLFDFVSEMPKLIKFRYAVTVHLLAYLTTLRPKKTLTTNTSKKTRLNPSESKKTKTFNTPYRQKN